MHQKINITLPEHIAHLIEQMADEKSISRFIEGAVIYYMKHTGKITLRKQMKQGALKRAQRDLKLSHEWNSLEDSIRMPDRGLNSDGRKRPLLMPAVIFSVNVGRE